VNYTLIDGLHLGNESFKVVLYFCRYCSCVYLTRYQLNCVYCIPYKMYLPANYVTDKSLYWKKCVKLKHLQHIWVVQCI